MPRSACGIKNQPGDIITIMTEKGQIEEEPTTEIISTVVERATEVIGDRERALRWLGTPVRALNFATPISLLNSEEGLKSVLTILGRLEHGIA